MADPVHQRRKGLRPGTVMGFTPVAAMGDQSGTLECGQMLRDHRLRYTRTLGQSMHGLAAVAGQPFEDRPASGIGQGLEEIVCRTSHTETITIGLWFVNSGLAFCLFDQCILAGRVSGFCSIQDSGRRMNLMVSLR